MERWFAAVCMSMVVCGCESIVLQPLEDAGAPSKAVTALAMRGEDVPPNVMEVSVPGELVLLFSNAPMTCDAPTVAMSCDSAPVWQFAVALPPEVDQPGHIDLLDFHAPYTERLDPIEVAGECMYSHMHYWGFGGTLDISRSDPTSLSVDLQAPMVNGRYDGSYVAERCGPPPLIPEPQPAIAVRESSSASSASGGRADPGALFVHVGGIGASCADPVGALGCDLDVRFTFTLPPELQQPARLDLSDPRLAATYDYSSLTGTAPSCVHGPEAFPGGVLDIRTVDDEELTFGVYGGIVEPPSLELATDVDGLYAASICP